MSNYCGIRSRAAAWLLSGQVSEFDLEKEEWSQYIKRLSHYFAANKVENAAAKREILLSIVGPTTFKLLTSLVAPVDPGDMTYK